MSRTRHTYIYMTLLIISSSWDWLHHFSQFLLMKCLKKNNAFWNFQRLASLWLVSKIDNHVGIYGYKVAEGFSAFQRRPCSLSVSLSVSLFLFLILFLFLFIAPPPLSPSLLFFLYIQHFTTLLKPIVAPFIEEKRSLQVLLSSDGSAYDERVGMRIDMCL